MKLAIDATNVGSGGGITVLLAYLREWVKVGRSEHIYVWASRPEVLKAVAELTGNICVEPFMTGKSSAEVNLASQWILPCKIEKRQPDALMTNLRMLKRCKVPQLVHHQNLWWQMHEPFFVNMGKYGLKKAIRYQEQKRSYRYALKHAQANTYISQYMCDLANSQYPAHADRNYPVCNGCPQDYLNADEMQHQLDREREPIIVSVQGSGPYKQSEHLLYMLKNLKESRPDVPWKLIVIGSLYNQQNFERLTDELGCRNDVVMTGFIPLEEIYSYFGKAFCHVFPSRFEGFGITPLEAMMMGCPVVASDCTAIPEVVGDAGILVSPSDPNAFANGVLKLYNDAELRRRYIERGFIQIRKFSWEKSANRMYEILCTIAGVQSV